MFFRGLHLLLLSKCSRGYIYSRGYVYSRVQSNPSMTIFQRLLWGKVSVAFNQTTVLGKKLELQIYLSEDSHSMQKNVSKFRRSTICHYHLSSKCKQNKLQGFRFIQDQFSVPRSIDKNFWQQLPGLGVIPGNVILHVFPPCALSLTISCIQFWAGELFTLKEDSGII